MADASYFSKIFLHQICCPKRARGKRPPLMNNTWHFEFTSSCGSEWEQLTSTKYLSCESLIMTVTGYRTILSCGLTHCKVAGSNLTCRDERISRWRLHSVGPTSTGLSSLGQNIIHSPVARVVCGQCQDPLKTCPSCNMASQGQSRRKRQFFFAVSHFRADLTV